MRHHPARGRLQLAGVLLLAAALLVGAAALCARQAAARRHEAHLRHAASQRIDHAVALAERAVEERSEEFRWFISSRKKESHAFARQVTSLRARWRTVKSRLPGTDSDGLRKYIQEAFQKRVLSTNALAEALKQSVEGSLEDVDRIQNDLAAGLRQELTGCRLPPNDVLIAQQDFRQAIQRLASASEGDTTRAAGSEVTSEVESWVARKVLLELGFEVGILAAGIVNSWWTFGASLMAGLVVEALWHWFEDPVGKIETEVDRSLDSLATQGQAALAVELKKLVAEKKRLWKLAADEMLKNDSL